MKRSGLPDKSFIQRVDFVVRNLGKNLLGSKTLSSSLTCQSCLLSECVPLAFIFEQAGGRASNGKEQILAIPVESIQQRSPLVIGSQAIDKAKENQVA